MISIKAILACLRYYPVITTRIGVETRKSSLWITGLIADIRNWDNKNQQFPRKYQFCFCAYS
jgi:hypothetical protein